MHEEDVDVVKGEIFERDVQRRGHIAMVVPPVLGDNGNLRAWNPAVADSPADDRLYTIVLGCVDQAVAALESMDDRFFESAIIAGSKAAWHVSGE